MKPAGCNLRGRGSLLPLLLALGLIAGPGIGADRRTEQTQEAAAKTKQLEQLRGRIRGLRNELGAARKSQSGLRGQLQQADEAIGVVARRIGVLERDLESRRTRLQALQDEREHLIRDRDGQRAELAAQLRAAYVAGRSEYLKLLLNQEDPALLGRTLVYYDYLAQARAAKIQALAASLRRLAAVEASMRQESDALARQKAELDRQRAALSSDRQRRERLWSELSREIGNKDRELLRMEADAKDLDKVLQALREALKAIPPDPGHYQPFRAQRGKLRWPADGAQPVEAQSNGLFIRAAEGQAVRAVYPGRVAFAESLRGFGLLLIIDHGHGYMSLYGHNQSLLKAAGDWVQGGESVATVGRSGGHAEPGLYFEIRFNGKPDDPRRWLAQR